MSPAAAALVRLLAPHTPFAAAIVRRQAERAGLNVATMDDDDVRTISRDIIAAAAVFVDPPVLEQIAQQLGVPNDWR